MTVSISSISQIVASIGVVASLLLLAFQTRRLSQQVEVGNAVGITEAHHNALERLHELELTVVNSPELIPYFREQKACPPTDQNCPRVLAIASMMGDVYDFGLEVTRRFPDAVHGECWPASARAAMRQPVLAEMFGEHSKQWWPDLAPFVVAPNRRMPAE
jgi:hypothetical protein